MTIFLECPKLICRLIQWNLIRFIYCISLLFCRIDKDGNGAISADELQLALSNGEILILQIL